MSKPKRRSVAIQLGEEDSFEDSVVTLSPDNAGASDDIGQEAAKPDHNAEHANGITAAAEPASPAKTRSAKAASKQAASGGKRRSPNDNTRHTYHASLYLPEEAQFALREIALTMRRAKPHDVMLEAMAEMFEKYNKGKLAKECRARISSRDNAVT